MSIIADSKKSKNILIVILSFLLLCIIVLSIFIFINLQSSTIANQNNSNDSSLDALNLESATIEEIISYYQQKIDSAPDPAKKVEYYDARLKAIIEKDIDREHTSQVISDVISIDDIEQSASSALQVCSYASYFGEQALYDKYYTIYEERQAASGPTTEGRG